MVKDWNQSRSSFNHAWLKNRFIVALDRFAQVLNGSVIDQSAAVDLLDRLSEWPDRHCQARQLLSQYEEAGSPSRRMVEQYLPHASDEITEYLVTVLDLRSGNAPDRTKPVEAARSLLRDLDSSVNKLKESMERQRPDRGMERRELESDVKCVRRNAANVAAAFSSLVVPGSQ